MPSELAAFGEIPSHLDNPLALIGLALSLIIGVYRTLIRSGILPPVDQGTSGAIIESLLSYGFWIAVLIIVLGIAYAAYRTHRETQPANSVDNDKSRIVTAKELPQNKPAEITKETQSLNVTKVDGKTFQPGTEIVVGPSGTIEGTLSEPVSVPWTIEVQVQDGSHNFPAYTQSTL